MDGLLAGYRAGVDHIDLVAKPGEPDRIDHLVQTRSRWRQAGVNGWQAACYGASAASDWLCAGGFRF